MNLLLLQAESINPFVWVGAGISVGAFLLTILGTVIAFVRWGVSLEAKNARSAEKIERLERDEKETRDKLDAHMINATIHFSQEVSKQVDEKNKQRFEHIETELGEINGKLDSLINDRGGHK